MRILFGDSRLNIPDGGTSGYGMAVHCAYFIPVNICEIRHVFQPNGYYCWVEFGNENLD